MLHIGTLIVLLITTMELWVAAGSHVIAIGAQQVDVAARCKIHRVGSIFYAEAGLLQDTIARYNAAAIAAQAAVGHPTVPDVANTFEVWVCTPLVETVRTLRTLNPRYYHAHLQEQVALQVAFFGLARQGPPLAIQRFGIHEEDGGSLSAALDRFDCPGDCPRAMTWAFLGGSEGLTQLLEAHPRDLAEHGARATLQQLMDLEATAHPDRVSPPVDILHLGPEGFVWVQRQPSCPPLPPS